MPGRADHAGHVRRRPHRRAARTGSGLRRPLAGRTGTHGRPVRSREPGDAGADGDVRPLRRESPSERADRIDELLDLTDLAVRAEALDYDASAVELMDDEVFRLASQSTEYAQYEEPIPEGTAAVSTH